MMPFLPSLIIASAGDFAAITPYFISHCQIFEPPMPATAIDIFLFSEIYRHSFSR